MLAKKLLLSLEGGINPKVEETHLDDIRQRRSAVRSCKTRLINGPVELRKVREIIARSKPEDYDGHTEFERLSPSERLDWLDGAVALIEDARTIERSKRANGNNPASLGIRSKKNSGWSSRSRSS
jgi:hypothetical protein